MTKIVIIFSFGNRFGFLSKLNDFDRDSCEKSPLEVIKLWQMLKR